MAKLYKIHQSQADSLRDIQAYYQATLDIDAEYGTLQEPERIRYRSTLDLIQTLAAEAETGTVSGATLGAITSCIKSHSYILSRQLLYAMG